MGFLTGLASKGGDFLKDAGSKLLDFASSLGLGAIGRKWNRQDYERQLADQERLIDEERAYNDYDSVMRRAAKAGVNPLHALGVGAVSGGNTTTSVPDISQSNVNPLNVGGFLDSQMKREQIRAMKIENEFRADRLELENAYAAAKIKTEESLQSLNAVEVKNKEALTAYTQSQTRFQELLNEYQKKANPQLLDNLKAEYDKMYAETTKLDNENAVFKEQFVANMRNLLAQTYNALYQAKYYRSASEWAGYRAETDRLNATTASQNVSRQSEFDKALIEYNKASLELRKDMSSSEKWANYSRSLEVVGNLLLSGFAMSRQPNQLPPVNGGNLTMPYGNPNPFETPYSQ